MHISRSAYYKWDSGKLSVRTAENEEIAKTVEKIHTESPDKGYRRINDDLRHDYGIHGNDTDVTEFKWYEGIEVHKIYLSAILDLCDRRIVSYVIGDRNDNALVFKTFDKAVKANPDAHPLFHSDRGFQYTNRAFHQKLEKAGMTQSMSRVAKCIDNGPMEGFWGILKRERYYGRRFTSREELVHMIRSYISYYNNRRVQRNLGILTPMEKHQQCLLAA
mgnify:CR=1 FL=1